VFRIENKERTNSEITKYTVVSLSNHKNKNIYQILIYIFIFRKFLNTTLTMSNNTLYLISYILYITGDNNKIFNKKLI